MRVSVIFIRVLNQGFRLRAPGFQTRLFSVYLLFILFVNQLEITFIMDVISYVTPADQNLEWNETQVWGPFNKLKVSNDSVCKVRSQ